MRTLRRFMHDIRALVGRRRGDDDVGDELEAFLHASVTHKMQSGLSREEATWSHAAAIGEARDWRQHE